LRTIISGIVCLIIHEMPLHNLKIGPKDGEDTKRPLALNPEVLVLVDPPDKETKVRQWLGAF